MLTTLCSRSFEVPDYVYKLSSNNISFNQIQSKKFTRGIIKNLFKYKRIYSALDVVSQLYPLSIVCVKVVLLLIRIKKSKRKKYYIRRWFRIIWKLLAWNPNKIHDTNFRISSTNLGTSPVNHRREIRNI